MSGNSCNWISKRYAGHRGTGMGENVSLIPTNEYAHTFDELWNTPAEGEGTQDLFVTEIDETWFADESANYMNQLTARAHIYAGD